MRARRARRKKGSRRLTQVHRRLGFFAGLLATNARRRPTRHGYARRQCSARASAALTRSLRQADVRHGDLPAVAGAHPGLRLAAQVRAGRIGEFGAHAGHVVPVSAATSTRSRRRPGCTGSELRAIGGDGLNAVVLLGEAIADGAHRVQEETVERFDIVARSAPVHTARTRRGLRAALRRDHRRQRAPSRQRRTATPRCGRPRRTRRPAS